MNPKKKVIIVYDYFGTGHFRMADILKKILLKTGGNLEIKLVTGCEIINSKSVKSLVFLWNYLLKKNMVRVVDFIVGKIPRYLTLPLLDIGNDKKMYDYLEKEDPDIIIVTEPGFTKGLGYYAKKNSKKYFVFVSDLFPSYLDYLNSYAHHLVYLEESKLVGQNHNPNLTYFKNDITHKNSLKNSIGYFLGYLADNFIQKNKIFYSLNNLDKVKNNFTFSSVGLIADKKHYQLVDKKQVMKKLGLDSHRPTILIASGGSGGRFITKSTKILANNLSRVNILSVCGRDQKSLKKISQIKKRLGSEVKIKPFSFINNLNELMAISDIAIIRPSASTLLECSIHNLPMLVSLPTSSNDYGCVEIINKYKLGESFRQPTELVKKIKTILKQKTEYEERFNTFKNMYPSSFEQIQNKISKIILENQ